MIVFKNLSWQTRSDKPNEDWTEQAKWVVPDGSPLAAKIMSTPRWTPVEDEHGNLIDIEAVEIQTDRKAEIVSRLAEIDTEETRPLAEITLATLTGDVPNSFAATKLSELEAEKVTLRAELTEL